MKVFLVKEYNIVIFINRIRIRAQIETSAVAQKGGTPKIQRES